MEAHNVVPGTFQTLSNVCVFNINTFCEKRYHFLVYFLLVIETTAYLIFWIISSQFQLIVPIFKYSFPFFPKPTNYPFFNT